MLTPRYGQLRKEGKAWPGGITMQVLTARPKSRGRVGVYSADPFAHPKVRATGLLSAAAHLHAPPPSFN